MNSRLARLLIAGIIGITLLMLSMLPALGGSYNRGGQPTPDFFVTDRLIDPLNVPEVGPVEGVTLHLILGDFYINSKRAMLTSPMGTTVVLWDEYCSDTDHAINIIFDDAAATAASTACGGAQVSGAAYQPAQALATFNGEEANGSWTLTVVNTAGNMHNPLLLSWTLDISVGSWPPDYVPPPSYINDGRANRYDVAAPVAVYHNGDLVDVYGIDPASGQGVLVAQIPAAAFDGPPDATHRELFSGTHPFYDQPVYVHLLNTGEAQVTAYDSAGQIYTFIWTP
jgi:hypothetical protein